MNREKMLATCEELGIEEIEYCLDCGSVGIAIKNENEITDEQIIEVCDEAHFHSFFPLEHIRYRFDLQTRTGIAEFQF